MWLSLPPLISKRQQPAAEKSAASRFTRMVQRLVTIAYTKLGLATKGATQASQNATS